MAADRELSLVIPTWNSGANLGPTVETVLAFLAAAGLDGEVVIADDGSSDGSSESLPPNPRVQVLRLPHAGKGAALRAGMQAATGEIRAFTDADLPYGLDPLPLAVRYIRERRFHAVVGDRTLPGSSFQAPGPLRRAISAAASYAFRTFVTGGIYDTQCGFKVFRGDVAAEVFRLARIDGFAIDVEVIYLLLKHRLDIKRIPVRLERNAPSSVRVLKDSAVAMRDIAAIRLNLGLGRYRSPVLTRLLQEELRAETGTASTPPGSPLEDAPATAAGPGTTSPRGPAV